MLSKVNQELDESKEDSFSDLPCELTITEDNRASGIANNLRFNMATFEASKKLLRESESLEEKNSLVKMTAESMPLEQNSLLRRLEIFEGQGQSLRLLHTVTSTGFNAAAPRLVYALNQSTAIVDRG